jgi:glycosyltransferase involved in cell wall biosynthesis
MQQLPKISIITPSFNQGHFIEETILSVINQNYPNIEYIIFDGGSTDNTVDIIRKYQDKIHYWISEPDNGQTHAINKGFKMATGDIIGWLNSDDILVKNGLNNLLIGFKKFPTADFIFGQSLNLTEKGSIEKIPQTNLVDFKLKSLGSFPFSQPSTFYKRSILNKVGYLDESFYSTMDFDLFVRIALNFSMTYIDLPIALFRQQKNAKTYQYNDIWEQERNRVLSRLIRSLNNNDWSIDLLRRFEIYEDENKSYNYPISITVTKQEVEKIIAIFIRDSVNFNFHANRFRAAYLLSHKFKSFLPAYFDDEIAFLHGRAKFYQYKILHLLLRPLTIFK